MKILLILSNAILGFLSLPVLIIAGIAYYGSVFYKFTTSIHEKTVAIVIILIYFAVIFFVNKSIYKKININIKIYTLVAIVIYSLSVIVTFSVYFK